MARYHYKICLDPKNYYLRTNELFETEQIQNLQNKLKNIKYDIQIKSQWTDNMSHYEIVDLEIIFYTEEDYAWFLLN